MIKNLVGKKFNFLTVIEKTNKRTPSRSVIWKCQCDCGNITYVGTQELTRKDGKATQSCGCLKKSNVDLNNKTFGLLTVIKKSDKKDNHRHSLWECQCACGENVYISTYDLIRTDGKARKACPKCSKVKDETGNIYNNVQVLSRDFSFKNSSQGAFWKCKCNNCGSIFTVSGHYLRQKNPLSCGCLKSRGEQKILNILNEYNILYQKEYIFNNLKSKNNYPLRFDFAIFNKNKQLIALIEYNGIQHYQNVGWNKSNIEFKNSQERDNQKIQFCKNNKIPLIIIPYFDYDKLNILFLLEKIKKGIDELEC